MLEKRRDCKRVARSLWIPLIIEFGLGIVFGLLLKTRTTYAWATVFLGAISMIMAFLYLCQSCEFKLTKQDFHMHFPLTVFISVFLFILGMNFANALILNFLHSLFHINIDTSDVIFTSNWSYNIALILSAVVIAPIFEELFFRGAILRILARYNKTFAIVVSSLLFGFMHMDITQFLFTFILGMILAHYSLKYHSMLVNIGLHFMNNLWAILVTLMYSFVSNQSIISIVEMSVMVLMVMGFVYGIIFLVQKRNEFHFERIDEMLIEFTFKNVAMIGFLFMSVISMIGLMFT